MPAHAPQGLCPACLLGEVLDDQDESQSPPGEPKSTAGIPGEPAATADDTSTDADGTATPVFSEPSGPKIDPALTANFADGDGPAGDEGSVDPGTRIRYFGDYEIRGELGSGAMGVVYKARQISLNRLVALKMIRAGALARRGRAEAVPERGRGGRPARPSPHRADPRGGRARRQSLFLDEADRRPVPEPDTLLRTPQTRKIAAKLMVTIAEAVHHAHQRGILHRDLKPSNILLDEQGQPHVSDFGLAKQVEGDGSLTESGAVLGTPAYMAPEQAAGSKRLVTTLSDVYGLGAVLYALLTGKPPFGGDSVMETLDRVRQQPPVPPSRLNPKVPRDLEIICLKCLDKDPQRRYPSAQALAAELRRFLGGEPIQARPVSAFEKGWQVVPAASGDRGADRGARGGGPGGADRHQSGLAGRGSMLARTPSTASTTPARPRQRNSWPAATLRAGSPGQAKAQTELAEQRLYDARMNLVQRYWEDYNGDALAARARRAASGQPGRHRSPRFRVVLLATKDLLGAYHPQGAHGVSRA